MKAHCLAVLAIIALTLSGCIFCPKPRVVADGESYAGHRAAYRTVIKTYIAQTRGWPDASYSLDYMERKGACLWFSVYPVRSQSTEAPFSVCINRNTDRIDSEVPLPKRSSN